MRGTSRPCAKSSRSGGSTRPTKAIFGVKVAGRDASWPVVGASLFSANISSQQFVGQAGFAYIIGLVAGGFQLVGAACFVLLAVFFVDVYRGLKLMTAPEFFERRYGPGARLFVAGINIIMILAANLAAALYAGATVLTTLLGWVGSTEFLVAVFVIAIGAAICAVFGGLRSVMWLDMFQATMLVIGGAVTLICGIIYADVDSLFALRDAGGNRMASVIQPWSHPFGWLPLITGALVLGVHGHCTDHDYVQRALAARNLYHCKMGAVFAAFLKVLAVLIIAAPGVIAVQLLPGLTHPDRAYTEMVTRFVPTGLMGFVLAGLVAAILGTMAAGLSAASSMITYDFVLKAVPNLAERSRVMLGRFIMVAILVLCSFAAPFIGRYSGLFVYLVKLWSLLAPPVFVCVVFGVFSRRADNRGAVATLIVGVALGGVSFFALDSPDIVARLPAYLRNTLNVGFVITLVCSAAMVLFSGSQNAAVALNHGGATAETPAMTESERGRYHCALGALVIVWLALVAIFSPWGIDMLTGP